MINELDYFKRQERLAEEIKRNEQRKEKEQRKEEIMFTILDCAFSLMGMIAIVVIPTLIALAL